MMLALNLRDSSEVGQVSCVRMNDLRDDVCSFAKCVFFHNCE